MTRISDLLVMLVVVVSISGCALAAGSPAPADDSGLSPTATATGTATPEQQRIQAGEAEPTLIGEEGLTTYYQLELENGEASLQYAVVLPDQYTAAEIYPVLLAFPPGPQTKEMVEVGLSNYWASEAAQRGWIVISPIAAGGTLFFQGSEKLMPEFLARISELYPPEGDKYHVAGISNGGISAFRVALDQPALVHSVLVLPGFPRTDEELDKLSLLAEIPVAMFAGERDTSWVQRMARTEEILSTLGGQVSLEVVPNEGHVIGSLTGGEAFFDLLESFR